MTYLGLLEMICNVLEFNPRSSRVKIQHKVANIYPGISKVEFILNEIKEDDDVESFIDISKAYGMRCLQQLFVKVEAR